MPAVSVRAPQKARPPLRLAYILAASHSGSTLLAMLLGTHPMVATVGELKATSLGDVNRYLCSCRRRLRDCAFWNSVASDMQSQGLAFQIGETATDYAATPSRYASTLLRPLHRGPIPERIRDAALAMSARWRRHVAHMHSLNATLVSVISARTKKPVLVDSSKTGLRLKYLLRNPSLDVRVIYMVRDGRGVALTHVKPSFADATAPEHHFGGTGLPPSFLPLSMREAVHLWRRSNEEAMSLVRQLNPSLSIRVRYETLCQDPHRTLSDVFSFLGVTPTVDDLDFHRHEHHVIGNGMRLDRGVDIRLDERWRSVLSPTDLRVFEDVGGTLNRSLGYEA